MTTKTNPLAVMDALDGNTTTLELRAQVIQARAVVAELVEAGRAFANDDRKGAWHPSYRPMMDRLQAALAAFEVTP